jgi:hypothetical protein
MLYTPKFAIGNIFVYPNGGLQPSGSEGTSGTELEVIQDFSVEFAGKGVELRGQQLYPIDARVTDISGKGKFKVGEWSLEQINNLFFAGTVTTSNTTGNEQVYADESHVVPSSNPLTVAVTNATGFVQPLTVLQIQGTSYTSLDEVTVLSGPGQYTCTSGGTFAFDAAQAGQTVLISYLSGGANASLNIPNNLQGQSPVVGIAGYNAADGNGFFFPYCRVTGVKPLELTMNKYAMNEVDFQVFAPLGQPVGQIIQSSY